MSSNFQAEYQNTKENNLQKNVEITEEQDLDTKMTDISNPKMGLGKVVSSEYLKTEKAKLERENFKTSSKMKGSPSQRVTSYNYIIHQKSGQFKPNQLGKFRESKSLLEGKRRTVQPPPHHDSFDSFSLHSNAKMTHEKLNFMINQKMTFDVYNQLNQLGSSYLSKSRSPKGSKGNLLNNSSNHESGKALMMAQDITSTLPMYQFGFNTRYEDTLKPYRTKQAMMPMISDINTGHRDVAMSGTSDDNYIFIDNVNNSMKNRTIVQVPSIQVLETASMDGQNFAKRSRSTQRTDHNLGMKFSRYSSVGPSNILKQSGRNVSVPKRGGDYHENLTQQFNYVKPGPHDYHLPGLFDNLKKGKDVALVKSNPKHEFGIKHSVHRIISKDHAIDNLGLESPGVAKYKDVKDRTFEQIKLKFSEGITPRSQRQVNKLFQEGQIGTFTTSNRFHETPTTILKANYPAYYSGVNDKFGQISQSKHMPSITEETQRVFESSKNRTFFGIPARCEGPGPAQNHNENQIAFQALSDQKKHILKQVEDIRNSTLNDRFTISQKIGYKEYQKGLQSKEIANNPSVADYKIIDFPYGKKQQYSMPKNKRKSNDLPVKDNSVSPQTYDCLTGQGYVDVKNLQLMQKLSKKSLHKSPSMHSHHKTLDPALNSPRSLYDSGSKTQKFDFNNIPKMSLANQRSPSKRSLAKSPSTLKKFDPSNLGNLLNSPTIDLYKTTYKIKGGKFPATHRKNSQF